jgi:hypothetical protein
VVGTTTRFPTRAIVSASSSPLRSPVGAGGSGL